MINALFAIGLVIVLFVIYGVLRPSAGCSGHCIGCDHSCDLNAEDKHVG